MEFRTKPDDADASPDPALTAAQRPARIPQTNGAPPSPVDPTRVSFENRTADERTSVIDVLREALAARLEGGGLLGRGGMATVELVRDRALERQTVLKRIHPDLAADPTSLRMFVREAQTTGQLEHPNIVPVHELGLDGESSLFFTMKLVEGRTLASCIEALPPGPLAHETLLDLLEVVLKVCDALSFAHSRGVLHLDVKPANVMVGDFGQVYLMDWGIAQRRDDAVEEPAPPDSSRRPLSVIGTATHMAPEQARGLTTMLDERTDVFSVGGLVYQILTRASPFDAETYFAALLRAQMASFTPIEELAPWAPKPLVRIVMRAMAREPADRYSNIAALRADLQQFMRGGGLFPVLHVEPGEFVVREGEPGETAYIIEHGRLEAVRDEGSERRVLRTMGPGEVFGEMAILAPGPRTASVVAVEASTLRVVSADTLEREVELLKPWMAVLVRTLAARFREREERR